MVKGEKHITGDDSDDQELECDNLGISTSESTIESMINNINLSIMQLRPESPTNTSCLLINSKCDDAGTSTLNISSNISTTTNVDPPARSQHCSTCHNTTVGHGKRSNAKCSMCPNDICSAAGTHRKCICQWHISQQTLLYFILLLPLLLLIIMLMNIFYLFVNQTLTMNYWGAMHVLLLLY